MHILLNFKPPVDNGRMSVSLSGVCMCVLKWLGLIISGPNTILGEDLLWGFSRFLQWEWPRY